MSDLHIKLCFIGYGLVMYAILMAYSVRVCHFEMKRICIRMLGINKAQRHVYIRSYPQEIFQRVSNITFFMGFTCLPWKLWNIHRPIKPLNTITNMKRNVHSKYLFMDIKKCLQFHFVIKNFHDIIPLDLHIFQTKILKNCIIFVVSTELNRKEN